jgi:putative ABC transport system ATP-binding protein
MSNSLIRTENLKKTYTRGKIRTDALRGVTLGIHEGTFCCIVGPSGHGKSTLMHLIGGLDRPTDGKVLVAGEDLTCLSPDALADFRARRIGFVFQFFNLLQGLTAEENIQTAMMFGAIAEKDRKNRARELLDLVGLSDKRQARPAELSGGQQQRVAIARALANDPDILLMDEPTGKLDSEAEAEVLHAVMALHQKGKTVVIVTHNPDIAGRAEEVIMIRDGRLAGRTSKKTRSYRDEGGLRVIG